MSDIQPGDVVVCINDGPWENPRFRHVPFPLRIGQIFRVARRQHLVLYMIGRHDQGYRVERFRKLHAEDTEISRRIRACKPVRARSYATDIEEMLK